MIHSTGGLVVLLGVATALLGIAIVGKAGHAKRSSSRPRCWRWHPVASAIFPRAADFRKGVAVAVFSGIHEQLLCVRARRGGAAATADARARYGPTGAGPACSGRGPARWIHQCQYLVPDPDFAPQSLWQRELVGELKMAGAALVPSTGRNYLLCALAGTAWYFQFFFYTMGESQMGRYHFSSWTLHMSSI